MTEDISRLDHPHMEYYRHTYAQSRRLEGNEVDGASVVIYCEQGYGDIIQFARFFRPLAARCAKVWLHCPPSLHRLFGQFGVELLHKFDPVLPAHDGHVLSQSLPFVLGDFGNNKSYLDAGGREELPPPGPFVGVPWEGGREHRLATDRNCRLSLFRPLFESARPVLLQREIHRPQLTEGCDDLEFLGAELTDWQDTAKLVAAVDIVVAVDTAVLHLAGALGKPAIGLLSQGYDGRWVVRPWYDSVRLLMQPRLGCWEPVLAKAHEMVRKFVTTGSL